MALEQFELVLHTAKMIGPSIRHLEFKRTDGKLLNFIPGQFITLLLKNEAGELKRRSYSIASTTGEATLSIAISKVSGGIASETLFALTSNSPPIKGMGPAGRLILQEETPARYILVGTGTGIAPYRAMLPDIAKRLEAMPTLVVHLILGVPYRESALYADDFLNFGATHPRFHFHAALSRETLPLLPHEQKCHVQAYFKDLNLIPTDDIVYLCGNPNMIDDAFKLLIEQGFPSTNIRREKYISSN